MSNTSTKLVDLTPGKPLLTISEYDDYIRGLAYLPGEKRLIIFAHNGAIRIWNIENGEQEGMAMKHDGDLEGFAVTKDGKRMLSGGEDKLLRVWDVETHQPIAEWGGHEGFIYCIAMSPNDQLVASGDQKGRIVIREMKEDGRIKHAIETGLGNVYSVSFSPDGTKLASGHRDHTIRVFDVETGDLILGPIKGHTDWVRCVVWSLDGSRLFTGSWDQTVRFWDSATGEAIGDPLTTHTHFIDALSLSPDGTKLASASWDATVRFWATDSGDPIGVPLRHRWSIEVFTFSPSGEFVACCQYSGEISIWRVPWWDDSKKAHKSLLDLPAVTVVPRHVPSDVGRQPDYLDLPTDRRPSSPRMPLRTTSATEVPSRIQRSAFSWRVWRSLARQLFERSHSQPRHAEVTTAYPGFATQRVYVASRDGESTPESRTEPLPTAPGHYPGFSIIVESVSSTESQNVNQPTSAPSDNSKGVQVSCCALFSRRRGRSDTPSVSPAIELSEHAPQTSNHPVPPGVTPSNPTAQNVLDLPAVVEPLSHTR